MRARGAPRGNRAATMADGFLPVKLADAAEEKNRRRARWPRQIKLLLLLLAADGSVA